MFCPKCATQNVDGASYCRSCGANVSLVPQALSGQLPQAASDVDGRDLSRPHRRRPISLERALKSVFMGIAFLLIAIGLGFSRVGTGWWFWMLIPAFSMMASGLAMYVRLKEQERRAVQPGNIGQPAFSPRQDPNAFAAPNTGQLAPPPSVTEGTTRHLGVDASTRQFTGNSPK